MPERLEARARQRIPAADRTGDAPEGNDRNSGERWARALTAPLVGAQLVAYLLASLLQPPPANEAVSWHWLGVVLNLAFVGALAVAALSADRPPTSIKASFGAGLIGLILVAGCPATGHHELTGWWYGQAALFAAAAAAPVLVWRRMKAHERA